MIAQIPTAQQIIPPGFRTPRPRTPLGGAVYEYEPDEPRRSSRELLPRNVAVQIFRALLENAASFYGAQMRRWTTPRATPAT